ncbi:hypothetical protein PMAYCL1PPCAC_15756, partial [Pristionchus mayeri]
APSLYLAQRDGSYHSTFIDEYRQYNPDAPSCLGIFFAQELRIVSFRVSTSLELIICFVIIVYFRAKTIKKIAKFKTSMSDATKAVQAQLSRALNLQLASSSFYFAGVVLY